MMIGGMKMNWKFKKNVKVVCEDFWYDLNEGYIKLEKLIEDKEQLQKLSEAIKLVKSFEEALEENGLLEDY